MIRTAIGDLPSRVGDDLGRTEWVSMPQERIDQFADATGDHQWIHVDQTRAAAGPFGGTIAHGYLTLAITGAAVAELLEVPDATNVINYGVNRVRFPGPVRSGSRLRVSGRIDSVAAVPGGQQVTVDLVAECEGADRPVCVAQAVVRFMN